MIQISDKEQAREIMQSVYKFAELAGRSKITENKYALFRQAASLERPLRTYFLDDSELAMQAHNFWVEFAGKHPELLTEHAQAVLDVLRHQNGSPEFRAVEVEPLFHNGIKMTGIELVPRLNNILRNIDLMSKMFYADVSYIVRHGPQRRGLEHQQYWSICCDDRRISLNGETEHSWVKLRQRIPDKSNENPSLQAYLETHFPHLANMNLF